MGLLNLETFTELKDFVDNSDYHEQRREILAKLDIKTIDVPIAGIIDDFARLPYCFTLQSCYGHFVYSRQRDPYNIEPLPVSDGSIKSVEYRIAYIALCIENSNLGLELFEGLEHITAIAPGYIQLGCAQWFWERQVNSYALQVQPDRFKHKDSAILDYREALHIERMRNEFFVQLQELLQKQQRKNGTAPDTRR